MSGTGRLGYHDQNYLIVDVSMEDEDGNAVYLDRMAIGEIEDRVPWDWLDEDLRVLVTFSEQLESPKKEDK